MNWKKFFAALLAVCLAVSCLCTNVFAEGGYWTTAPVVKTPIV